MTIKKTDAALETAAELFLTAFNGKIPDDGTLERTAAAQNPLDPQARWFRQTFTGPQEFELSAGISSEVAETLPGELTEFIADVFQTMARALGTVAGSAVSVGVLTEETAVEGLEEIAYELRRESISAGHVILAVPGLALSFLRRMIRRADSALGERSTPRHLDTLMNVDLPVTVSFGSTEMTLADVLRLTTGSIVEFNHLLSEPVNIIVNNCLVARGDVVVVDANYGVRISEVIARA
jgi:flagellar motor switch protein FliN/FliY